MGRLERKEEPWGKDPSVWVGRGDSEKGQPQSVQFSISSTPGHLVRFFPPVVCL